MNPFPMQHSQMVSLPPIQGIPKHLSPEQAASAPHSQEAAHPSGEAKTDEVIECVVRGETRLPPPLTDNARREKFLKELSRFEEIFSWYSSGRDPNSKNAPKPKYSRKRTALNSELDPSLKKFISSVVESEGVKQSVPPTAGVKEEKWTGANPLKKMEMMTKSPAFEVTTMANLTDPRKDSRPEVDQSVPSTSAPSAPPPPTTFPSLVSPFQPPPYMHHQYPMQHMAQPGLPPHGYPSPSFIPPNHPHPQSFHHPYQQFARPFPYPS